MSDAPNIIIPAEHQSSPKEHWITKEISKAAEEIERGQFKPQLQPDDYFYYGPEQLLGMHPRIVEALQRMEAEVKESRTSQETIEKAQMYHELCEIACKPEQWDGQGRWIGKENEEMRQGELLEPKEFMRRLSAVIGDRIELNRFAVAGRVALLIYDPQAEERRLLAAPPKLDYSYTVRQVEKSASPAAFKAHLQRLERHARMQEEKPQATTPEYLKDKAQVATLQWPIGTEWMIMRFNQYGVPTSAKHLGWRTALLSMITLGVITEAEAHAAFPVKENAASIWYRAQLYHLRNGARA
jgi:hypothetical protein